MKDLVKICLHYHQVQTTKTSVHGAINVPGLAKRLKYRGDDPKQRQSDISPVKSKLGWEPEVPLEQGLWRTVDFFRQMV